MDAPQEYVYVLQLQSEKWYIGRSKSPSLRLKDHAHGTRGSAWTRLYPMVDLWDMKTTNSALEEDHLTEEYMHRYGIENVRGGSYAQVKLPVETVQMLQRKFLHASDACLRCGKKGHFIKDCSSPMVPQRQQQRTGHWTRNRVKMDESRARGMFGWSNNSLLVCSRCGRNSHCVDDCFANTHITGGVIITRNQLNNSIDDSDSANQTDSDCESDESDNQPSNVVPISPWPMSTLILVVLLIILCLRALFAVQEVPKATNLRMPKSH
jgi:predicted GIY-YIG superfamily endonuclease/ribosomal protein L37E